MVTVKKKGNVKGRLDEIIRNHMEDSIENPSDLESENLNDLGIDSADIVDLVIDVEENFDIDISNEEIEKIRSYKDILLLVEKKSRI